MNRISMKILLFMLIGIVSITGVFNYTSRAAVLSAYRSFFSDKTLQVSRIISSQISGDDLMPYIEAISADAGFRQDQLAFQQARQRLFELEGAEITEEAKEAASDERERLWEQIRRFYRKNKKFKDEKYIRMQAQLEHLRVAAGTTYLYIFTDTGLPGLFTYIMDAHTPGGEETSLYMDDIGTVNVEEEFEGARDVLALKQQADKALYDDPDGVYGELYFSYSPLFDSKGNAVAVVGTDIDLSGMNRQVAEMAGRQMRAGLIGATLFIVVFYFLLRRVVVKPIVALTDIAVSIADGHVGTPLPGWLLGKKDEMGRLSKALSSMTGVFQKFLTDAKQLFNAAMTGRLDARVDPSDFEGDFALFASQINDTLDIIGMYFDSMPEAVFILDAGLEPMFQNRQYNDLFGHMFTEKLVRKLLCVADPADEPDSQDPLKTPADAYSLGEKWDEALAKGVYTASAWVTLRDGTENCFSFTCRDLVLNGVKRGTVVIAANVTDLMNEKAKAQSASKAKGEFLSRVSHELRSPMNVIIGMAKLGLKNAEANSRVRFESIVSASGHLLRIINDVLDMSRIESGKLEIRYAQFNLRSVISDCVNLLRQQADDKKIIISLSIEPGVASEVVGDGAHLSQVLVNLLTNSIKFTEDGGSIVLSAGVSSQDGENLLIRFSVEDDGIGMSEEFMRKIFTPFEQEDQYLQRRYHGTGLGLSICHRLVTLMGGALEVKSRVGEGSAFSFTLPFLIAEEQLRGSPEADSELSHDFSALRLLLVDDIALNRLILIESLADTGLSVTEAGDGAEALQLFENSAEGYFDVIFMDVQMPRMDGYQATEAIRALPRKDAGLPVFAMTANALLEDVEQALARGMTGHISKPVDIDECVRALAKIAESKTKRPWGFAPDPTQGS